MGSRFCASSSLTRPNDMHTLHIVCNPRRKHARVAHTVQASSTVDRASSVSKRAARRSEQLAVAHACTPASWAPQSTFLERLALVSAAGTAAAGEGAFLKAPAARSTWESNEQRRLVSMRVDRCACRRACASSRVCGRVYGRACGRVVASRTKRPRKTSEHPVHCISERTLDGSRKME